MKAEAIMERANERGVTQKQAQQIKRMAQKKGLRAVIKRQPVFGGGPDYFVYVAVQNPSLRDRYNRNRSGRGPGYTKLSSGSLHVGVRHEREMKRLWRKSSVMSFSKWDGVDPETGREMRWYAYYRRTIPRDVARGRLTSAEGRALREYLDVLGT